jgi:hypothetical protein
MKTVGGYKRKGNGNGSGNDEEERRMFNIA